MLDRRPPPEGNIQTLRTPHPVWHSAVSAARISSVCPQFEADDRVPVQCQDGADQRAARLVDPVAAPAIEVHAGARGEQREQVGP